MGSIPIGRTISTKESKMSISYVLRTCNADFTSRWDCDFRWPASGEVVCPDFEATEECGSGLHGFLDGCGDGNSAKWESDAQWLLVAVPSDTIIDLGGEVKFPSGEVIFSSQDRLAVIAELEASRILGVSHPSLKRWWEGTHVCHPYLRAKLVELLAAEIAVSN